MFFGNYNSMNMFGMNGMFGMGSSFSTNNLVSQLFSGTNSIFNAGCFGGGSNFFGGMPSMFGNMSTMFGGGCSLFTNCNGSVNYDAMAGWGVANALLGVGAQAFNHYMAEKKEYSSKTIQADIQGIDSQIQEQAQKLGCDSAEEALNFSVEGKYTTAIESVESNIREKDLSLENHNKSIRALELELQSASDTEKSGIQTKLDTAKAERDKVAAEIKKLKEEDLVYANNAKDAREKEIKKIQAEIRNLQGAKENAIDQLNEKSLNKADGNQIQRTDFKDLDAKFGDDGKLKEGQKVSKADVRAVIKGYRTATGSKEKIEWKNKFIELWDKLVPEDRTKDLRSACAIIAPELYD